MTTMMFNRPRLRRHELTLTADSTVALVEHSHGYHAYHALCIDGTHYDLIRIAHAASSDEARAAVAAVFAEVQAMIAALQHPAPIAVGTRVAVTHAPHPTEYGEVREIAPSGMIWVRLDGETTASGFPPAYVTPCEPPAPSALDQLAVLLNDALPDDTLAALESLVRNQTPAHLVVAHITGVLAGCASYRAMQMESRKEVVGAAIAG